MTSAHILMSALLLLSLASTGSELTGQKPAAGNALRRIVNAYCDDIGAHVVYDSGSRLLRRARAGQQCADLQVSEDRHDVGWLMQSEATADSEGKVLQRWTRSDLFINGIQVKYEGAALYNWRFHDEGRRVVFEAGPLHGGGDMFLYDVAKGRVIDQCLRRQQGVACPAWAQ